MTDTRSTAEIAAAVLKQYELLRPDLRLLRQKVHAAAQVVRNFHPDAHGGYFASSRYRWMVNAGPLYVEAGQVIDNAIYFENVYSYSDEEAHITFDEIDNIEKYLLEEYDEFVGKLVATRRKDSRDKVARLREKLAAAEKEAAELDGED